MNGNQSNNILVKSTLHFLLLLSLICTLMACNKEPKYKTAYLDAGLKAAFNNKPGSYWIYRDSVSEELDSLYLVSNVLKIDEGYTTIRGMKYEEMMLNYESTHIGNDTSYSLHLSLSFSTRTGNMLSNGLNRISFQPLNFWFTYPFNYPGPVSKTDTIISSRMTAPLSVGTRQFNNIVTFIQSRKTNLSEGSTGFWSDTRGLVKMRFLCKNNSGTFTKVLELQRWKLIK